MGQATFTVIQKAGQSHRRDAQTMGAWSSAPLVLLVPLVQAGMGAWGRVAATMAAALFVVVTAWQVERHRRVSIAKAILPGVVALAALMLIQVVPIPATYERWLSPRLDDVARWKGRTQFYGRVSLEKLGLGPGASSLLVPESEVDLWRGDGAVVDDVAPKRFRALSVDPGRTTKAFAWLLGWLALVWAFAACGSGHRAQVLVMRLLAASGALIALLTVATRVRLVRPLWGASVLNADPVSTFVNRDHLATFCLMLFPVLAQLVWVEVTTPASDRQRAYRRVARTILLSLGAAWVVTACLLANSRAGSVLVFAEALAMLGVVAFARRRNHETRLGITFATLAIVVAALFMEHGRFLTRLIETLRHPLRVVFVGRYDMATNALRLFGQFPIAGVGLGCAGVALEVLRMQPHDVLFDHVHNEYIEWLAETGLLGLLAGGCLAATLVRALRGTRWAEPGTGLRTVALGALAIHSLVDFPLRTTAVSIAAAAILGLMLGDAQRNRYRARGLA